MISLLHVLAQNAPTNPAAPQGPPPWATFMPLIIMVGLFLYIQFRSQRKERAKKQSLIDSMKKNDRVLTIGGIVGIISQVKDHEVVLKVDEATNTKMTITKRAIQTILSDDDDANAEAG